MVQQGPSFGDNIGTPPPYARPPQVMAPRGSETPDRRDLYAVSSAAIGISLLTMCIPVLGYLAVAVTAIVFGILGLKSGHKGLALAGLICSVVWLLGGIAFWLFYGAVFLASLGSTF